jgi:hypothetical protein
VRQHPDRDVDQADWPAEIGDRVHPELAALRAEQREQQELRRLER